MNLENIKSTTTWAEASGTMNNNNAKITEAIERLESAVEEGGGGGTADSVAWNKVTGKPSWITDSKPVYAKEDLSQGVQTSLDKADTALQAIPDGYATEEYTREQVRHILNLMSTALEGKVDKVDGKQLSTEDFTTALKEKLESLSSSGGGVDSEALQELSDRLDLIVSGGASGVIDSFVDIIAFLTGINDSVKLKDMLDTLRESILRKQNTIEDLDAIRSGASLGATAVQRGESVAHAVSADSTNILKGIVTTDFSGSDLNQELKLFTRIPYGTEGIFPCGDNANAVLILNRHTGNYNSQFGFNSRGEVYYRSGNTQVLTTQPWKQIAFTDSSVASAVFATSADSATEAGLLKGVSKPTDFSGSDLNVSMRLYGELYSGTGGLFPHSNHANAALTINRFPGKYNSQFGFSSNGKLYYRNSNNSNINNIVWNEIAFTSTKVDAAAAADKIETTEWIVGSHSSAPFVIRSLTYGGNVITCNHEGKVGVGTTISEDYALSVGGDVSVSGYVMTEGVSMYSQRSLKDVVDEEGLSLEELATIKPTRFTWKDGRDEKVHIGGIADDVQKVLPEAVRETPEGILTMDYPVASFAVASSLVKPVTDHEERIAELERENKQLREELEMIKRYIGYGNDK